MFTQTNNTFSFDIRKAFSLIHNALYHSAVDKGNMSPDMNYITDKTNEALSALTDEIMIANNNSDYDLRMRDNLWEAAEELMLDFEVVQAYSLLEQAESIINNEMITFLGTREYSISNILLVSNYILVVCLEFK